MNHRKAFSVVFLIGCLYAPTVLATDQQIEMIVNRNNQVCGTLHGVFKMKPNYFTFDHEKNAKLGLRYQTEYGNMGDLSRLVSTTSGKTVRLSSVVNGYHCHTFRANYAEMHNELVRDGLICDKNYKVGTPKVDFYGENNRRTVYSLRFFGMSAARKPEIRILDDGYALSRGIKEMKPSYLVYFGAFAYPVTYEPGHVVVYEIKSDEPNQPVEKQTFNATPLCEYVLAGRKQEAQESAPIQDKAQMPAVEPEQEQAQDQENACAAYEAESAEEAQCIDQMQKIKRMKKRK